MVLIQVFPYYELNSHCVILLFTLNLDVRFLDFLPCRHKPQPFFDHRVIVKREASERVQANPRLEVVINSSDTARQNALTSSLLQLSFKDIIAAIGLCRVSLERILILLGVKVSEEIQSQYHAGISSEFTPNLNQFACPVMGPSVDNKKYSHFSKSTKSCAESPDGPIVLPMSYTRRM